MWTGRTSPRAALSLRSIVVTLVLSGALRGRLCAMLTAAKHGRGATGGRGLAEAPGSTLNEAQVWLSMHISQPRLYRSFFVLGSERLHLAVCCARTPWSPRAGVLSLGGTYTCTALSFFCPCNTLSCLESRSRSHCSRQQLATVICSTSVRLICIFADIMPGLRLPTQACTGHITLSGSTTNCVLLWLEKPPT